MVVNLDYDPGSHLLPFFSPLRKRGVSGDLFLSFPNVVIGNPFLFILKYKNLLNKKQ